MYISPGGLPSLGLAQAPYPWESKFLPEQRVYTEGSDISGHPRLGAAVVHIPTSATIYIDVVGTKEIRAIMPAELVAIHTALATFAAHEWIGIFTDFLSSLHAIRHHHTNPSTGGPKHHHHHAFLLGSITDLLDTRRSEGFRTTHHKIKTHINIRGNDIADATAKLAGTYLTLSLRYKRFEWTSGK